MSWDSVYSQGTISIGAGATIAVGTGTFWGPLGRLANILFVGDKVAFVDAVIDDTHLSIPAWGAVAVSNSAYRLVQVPQSSALATKQIRDLLAKVDGTGVFYSVVLPATAPDPAIGEDGQYALQVDNGPWKFWKKSGGVWVLQGTPAGLQWRGPWSAATAYTIGDAVSRLSQSYISILAGTNHPPESSPTYWQLLAGGGSRYDLILWDNARPSSGEELLRAVLSTTVTFLAGLGDSRAVAEVAATASSVFSLLKNGAQFGTITFGAGSASGVFASAADTIFSAGDILTVVAPTPRDATLSGVSATVTGYR